jgi:glycosyltransferase involved in cell wall biosynthesis
VADVLYVCYEFPSLSQTFISNEFLQLRRSGVNVRALALYRAHPEDLGRRERELADETLCVLRPGLLAGFGDLFWALARRPGRTARAIAWLTRGEAPLRRWVAYASHLLYACHVARRVDLADVGVFHAHFATGPASVAMFLGLLTGKPFTVVAHAYDIYLDRMALGLKLETAAAFVTISNENREWLIYRYGARARNVRVIHCGVDTHSLAGPAAKAQPSEPPLIVAVGRLTAKKGHDTLIRACGLLRDQGVAFTCQIVGGGEEQAQLQSLIDGLGLTRQVRLIGPLPHDQALGLTASAAVAALACRQIADGDRDGIPVSLMEAMALGVPVVSTRVSGIPELVQHDQNGLLVEQDDPVALASALGALLREEKRRRALGAAGRRTVEKEFDLTRTTATMRVLLESVAPGLRGRPAGSASPIGAAFRTG